LGYRVLVIGDPHFRISNVRDAKKFTYKIEELIQAQLPDLVVILGDLHNDFERIHSLVSREICHLFRAILRYCKLVYVVGNHDYINNQCFLTDEHAFLPFSGWKDLTIIDQPIDFGTPVGNFLFVPYVPPGRFGEALSLDGLNAERRAIFCHQEFRGVQMGPITSKNGDLWPENAPLVVSGHIHEHQWLQPNILYVGSPYQTTFGEEDEKTVSLLEFPETGAPIHKRIDLGLPRRLTVMLTIEQAKEYVAPEGAMVRAYIEGTTEELAAFKKTKKFKELAKTLKLIPKPSDPVSVRRNATGRGFMDLLKEAVALESEAVQEAFREIQSAPKA
jgi:DNA repair exonuclease SbcCD nuclease subunit